MNVYIVLNEYSEPVKIFTSDCHKITTDELQKLDFKRLELDGGVIENYSEEHYGMVVKFENFDKENDVILFENGPSSECWFVQKTTENEAMSIVNDYVKNCNTILTKSVHPYDNCESEVCYMRMSKSERTCGNAMYSEYKDEEFDGSTMWFTIAKIN
jgi:hypothetical protein